MGSSTMPRPWVDDSLPPSILIVDDDEDLRLSVADVLVQYGYRVQDCGDAREALARLNEREVPDLILLDLHMPRMNGCEFRLAQQQQSVLAQIPVVVLSADPSREVCSPNADAYLSKPVDREGLIHTVERVLEAHTFRSAGRARPHDANEGLLQPGEARVALATLLDGAIRDVSARESPVHWVRKTSDALQLTGCAEGLSALLRGLLSKACRALGDADRVLKVKTRRLSIDRAVIEVSGKGPTMESRMVGAAFEELMSSRPACVTALTIQQVPTAGPCALAPSTLAHAGLELAPLGLARAFFFRLELCLAERGAKGASTAHRKIDAALAADRDANAHLARYPGILHRRRRGRRLDS